jgi:cytochrome c peroxidase
MEDLQYLTDKLNNLDYYPNLFSKAFGDSDITEDRISKAIAQFVGSITTNKSKFDAGLKSQFENFNELEKLGMSIFNSEKAKCSTCHSGNNFAADDSPGGEYGAGPVATDNPRGTTNIGLDLVYKDQGRNDGKFKIPSLRNIALTGPYMHDGRFQTLEEVINHYSGGIKPHKDLDKKFKNKNGEVIHLNLDPIEKQALVAFLHTLTDYEMIKDPKYSDPFKH